MRRIILGIERVEVLIEARHSTALSAHRSQSFLDNPIAGWAPRYLIRDRDQIYGATVTGRLRAMGIRDRPVAPASPWQNGFVERLIGSIRRECVDHFIVLGEAHLRRILRTYAGYYNLIRTHQSLDKDTKSRLMHSAGIQAMGVLMDRIMTRLHGHQDPRHEITQSLRRIRSHCHWTDGTWEGLGLKWNEIQNVPKHVRDLSDLLVRLDFTLTQKAA